MLDVDLPALKLVGYQEALADVPLRSLLWACKEAEKVCEFMPKPLKLRELAGKAPALSKAQQPYNVNQIEESTKTSQEDSKARLAALVAGFEDWNEVDSQTLKTRNLRVVRAA